MAVLHFLNVREGDCSIILHNSSRVTMIDVCNAEALSQTTKLAEDRLLKAANTERGIGGNFNQKAYPVNPLQYMQDRSISSIFRFVLTHPDMDHMDGIEAVFDAHAPLNFWDTDNNKDNDFSKMSGPYAESDWLFYKNLRDSKPTTDPKRITNLSGSSGQYWNKGDESDGSGGDGLHVLAPTDTLMAQANECGDYNDASYVLLYRTSGSQRILFSGDSDDDTWTHILRAHSEDVKNVDLLIAPHHGRDSGRSYEFLDHVKPKLTFFGNASSQHLAYDAWYSRGLPYITNNQANCMLVDTSGNQLTLYVTHEAYAKKRNPNTFFSNAHQAWYCEVIS